MERKKQHLRIERKHPRVDTEVNCVLGVPGRELSAALICDMSEGGLKFSCERQTIYNILPENKRTPGLINDVVVEIRFELQPPDLAAQAIECKASLVHFERLAQDDFHVGIEFMQMDKTAKQELHTFLESAPVMQDG